MSYHQVPTNQNDMFRNEMTGKEYEEVMRTRGRISDQVQFHIMANVFQCLNFKEGSSDTCDSSITARNFELFYKDWSKTQSSPKFVFHYYLEKRRKHYMNISKFPEFMKIYTNHHQDITVNPEEIEKHLFHIFSILEFYSLFRELLESKIGKCQYKLDENQVSWEQVVEDFSKIRNGEWDIDSNHKKLYLSSISEYLEWSYSISSGFGLLLKDKVLITPVFDLDMGFSIVYSSYSSKKLDDDFLNKVVFHPTSPGLKTKLTEINEIIIPRVNRKGFIEKCLGVERDGEHLKQFVSIPYNNQNPYYHTHDNESIDPFSRNMNDNGYHPIGSPVYGIGTHMVNIYRWILKEEGGFKNRWERLILFPKGFAMSNIF